MIVDEGQPKNSEKDLSSLQDVRFPHILFGLCSIFLISLREHRVYQTRTEQWLWFPNTPSDSRFIAAEWGLQTIEGLCELRITRVVGWL